MFDERQLLGLCFTLFVNVMISIIIPIYNSALYLERCLESILRQTYQDFEILLIDDGSTDGSRAVCEKYCDKDDRFHYFYKINGGVSSARNLGLKQAKGEFIFFMDSDDTISENTLAWHLDRMKENVDLTVSGYDQTDENGAVIWKSDGNGKAIQIWSGEQYVRQCIKCTHGTMFGMVWLCLFRASVIRKYHLRFDESIAVSEDTLFNISYSCYCQNVYFENTPIYNYYQLPESSIHSCGKTLGYRYVSGTKERKEALLLIRQFDFGFKTRFLAKFNLFYSCVFAWQYLSQFEDCKEKQKYWEEVDSYYSQYLNFWDKILFQIYDKVKCFLKR